MPQINRIRVNNVKYNFGTQYYDDFMMRFHCRNTIYDLANGGGKSLLMLLLLQNVIPNCTLDEKQPVEKLFRPGGGNTVIHSLIEWKLDTANNDGYKYMTTGFCARKAKDTEADGTEADGISGRFSAAEELMAMQAYVEQIYVDDRVYDYVARIAKATRNSPEILQGISPRGSIAVLAIAKAEAFLRGHTYVLPSDIQYVLMDAAAHRIIVDNGLRNGNVTAETALKNVLETVSVPKLDVKRVV